MQTHPGESALEGVMAYHEETKHHLARFARSPGYLKWEDQPSPFREFTEAPHIELPLTNQDSAPSFQELFSRRSSVAHALTRQTLGHFFQFSLALSAWKETPGARWSLRINPSSGNLHPTEAYVLLPPVEGIDSSSGAYHYLSRDHSLQLRYRWEGAPANGFYVAFTSIPWREAWKYGERAFRYCQHDLGHALAATRFAAATLGWIAHLQTVPADYLDRLLELNPPAHALESEIPEALLWIQAGPAGAPFGLPEVSSPLPRLGRANRLSAGHTPWPIIDAVAALTRNPEEIVSDETPSASAWDEPRPLPCSAPATRIIRQRRSALDFDAATALPRSAFLQMLDLTLPRDQVPPFDVWEVPVSVHLALFVHRVIGLAPGLYLYVRNLGHLDALRSALRPDFRWACEQPSTCPLFCLQEGDLRDFARTVSCHQDIAADGAFSLGMLAQFEPVLRRRGPHAYRQLFWETGLIGQTLYLAAEAVGMRATGIGCYFDDLMHDRLGLRDRAWQSLYHFTIGAPVEDIRLGTKAPYAERREQGSGTEL